MQKRLMLTAIIAALAIGIVGTTFVNSLAQGTQAAPGARGAQQGQRGAPAPTAPCGPKSVLPENLAKNVAPNSRCFELRMYTDDPTRDGVGQFKGGINELHQRFREKELEIFKKHGAHTAKVAK